MSVFKLVQIVALLCFSGIFSGHAYAQTAGQPHAEISLKAWPEKVSAGDTVTIGIVQTIDQGWHTYWKNPGDSGDVMRVNWSGIDNLQASDFEWPVPEALPMGPLTNYGYENRAVILQKLTLPEILPDGPVTLTANVEILVCEEICIPEFSEITLTLSRGSAVSSPEPQWLKQAYAYMPKPVEEEAKAYAQDGYFILEISKTAIEALEQKPDLMLYPVEWGLVENASPTRLDITDEAYLLKRDLGPREVSALSQSRFVIGWRDDRGGHKGIEVTATHMNAAPAPASADVKTPVLSLWQAFLLAFAGGVILNLMPCVFPVLSIKALSMVKMRDEASMKTLQHGLAYTAGVLIMFGILAGALLALRAAGSEIGWGFQLQNPLAVTALAWLLFLVGLNLSGFFEVAGALGGVGQKISATQNLSGSFFTGFLAVIVATPCTAPFMAGALGFALTQSTPVAFGVFMMLGLGLAAPYLVISLTPALQKRLPKPGGWMVRFKELLAFPMYASAVWLLWVLIKQAGANAGLLGLLGALSFVFAIWLWRLQSAFGKGLAVMIAVLPVLALPLAIAPAQTPNAQIPAIDWQAWSPQALENALATGQPVFVDMTADWCITCKVNERIAIERDTTRVLFAENQVIALKGDWTNYDADITRYLQRFDRSGVPLYVYYGPESSETGSRPDPQILPQILTPGVIEDAMFK